MSFFSIIAEAFQCKISHQIPQRVAHPVVAGVSPRTEGDELQVL